MNDRRLRPAIAAALLFAGSLALFWPGMVTFDGVFQYRQALSGVYDDWHPPAMARLWATLHPLGPGAAPMLVLQLAGYWLGFGLLAAGLARRGRTVAAVAVLAIALFPPFLGWQGVVLKDAQMTGAMLAAVGLVAFWRLGERSVPRGAWAAVALLLGYATLVRANAVFASVPLAVMLAVGPVRWWAKAALLTVGTLAVLALAPVVNHGVMGAATSGVERTQALYDLAGIAVRVPEADDTGLSHAEVRTIRARHCVTPFFWDPLGDPDHCDAAVDRLRHLPVGTLYAVLVRAILHHPLAYAGHRLAHLNSTERWLVPAGWIGAPPTAWNEPNELGLAQPGAAARRWQGLGALLVETPFGWPLLWGVVASFGMLALARADQTASVGLARALFVSALGLEVSFAAISIASDLRYHLWAMIATALGVVLAAAELGRERRVLWVGVGALALVMVAGTTARLLLPIPPASYAGMLG